VFHGLGTYNADLSDIKNTITNGALFMPAFKRINGDTLKSLVDYIYNKKFRLR